MRRRRHGKRNAHAAKPDRARRRLSRHLALRPTVPARPLNGRPLNGRPLNGRPLTGRALRWAVARTIGGPVLGALATAGVLLAADDAPASVVVGLLVGVFVAAFYPRGADLDKPHGLWGVLIGLLMAVLAVPIWVPALYERSYGDVVDASVTVVSTHFERVSPHTRYDIQLFDDARGRYLPRWLDGTGRAPWRVGDRVEVYADPGGVLPPLLVDDADTNRWVAVLSLAGLVLTAAAARPWAGSIRVLPPGEPNLFQRIRDYVNG